MLKAKTFGAFLLMGVPLSWSQIANRPLDPVIITGDMIHAFLGSEPSEIVGFRHNGTGWQQIPIQVDERANVDPGKIYNTSPYNFTIPVYTDTGTFTGADTTATFDLDDELVFMAADAGPQAPTEAMPPTGTVAGSGLELKITDRVTPATGYVYLFKNGGSLSQSAGVSYVTYTFTLQSGPYLTTYKLANGPNPEKSTVVTGVYKHSFADRWLSNNLQLALGTNVNVIDTFAQFMFSPGDCMRSVTTFDSGQGAFITNKNGPVRAIRSYLGANSGPFTERTHLYYRGRQDMITKLRVHNISGGMILNDYNQQAAGMRYYNSNNSGGVVIDGTPDTVAAGPINWELVTGKQGSITISHLPAETNITTLAPSSYYEDQKSHPTKQCTGDNSAYGTSGKYNKSAVPCTDPNKGCTNYWNDHIVYYYEGPGITTDIAAGRNAWANNPLEVIMVSAFKPMP